MASYEKSDDLRPDACDICKDGHVLFVRSTDGKRIHSLPEPAGDMACAAQTKIFDTEPERLPITDTKGIVRFLPPKPLSEQAQEVYDEVSRLLDTLPPEHHLLSYARDALGSATDYIREFEKRAAGRA